MGWKLGGAASCRSRGRVGSHGYRFPFFFLSVVLFLFSLSACHPTRDAGEGHSDAPAAAHRAVSLVPSLNELILALGAGEHLAARTDFDTHPELLGLPSVGGGLDPSFEVIVDLGIDMVLMPGGRDTEALEARFEALGMAVHVLPTNTVSDLYGALARLGELFGVPQNAESLYRQMKEEIEGVGRGVRGRDPVPVMYVVAADPPMTTGEGTFIDELIQIAGGRNVFSDAGLQWPSVGFESILSRDPEFLVWPRGDYGSVSLEVLRTTPGWKEVPAVIDGRVLFVDGDLFSRPGPGFPEAARTLAAALHPAVFGPNHRRQP